MAGGSLSVSDPARNFDYKLTFSVYVTCIVAATGGLIFGYDIGISGGVTTMEPFLERFFPSVLERMRASTNQYCMFNSETLTAFTSSLYIAGLIGSLLSSGITKAMGRRFTMVMGGLTFLAGSILNAAAENVAMLIIGRILLGFGVGFTNSSTPVYLSEMAPPKWRGAFNIGFQLFIAIGVLVANLINYGVATINGNYGWRLSLGLAGVPAIIMTVGALLVPDSVSSLIERDRMQDARHALRKVRGSGVDIEPELQFFIDECERASAVKKPFMNIIKRQYRPQLVMCIAIPFFQQVGGIDVIAFYAPVIFRSLGLGSMTALLAAVILASVNFCSILVSMMIVDRHGRRVLFFAGGTQMFIFQVAMAVALAVLIGSAGDKPIAKSGGILMLVFMCLYASGFGWSWGPLSWLVPSEISPLEIRPAGQSISVSVNLAVTFILSQTFLAMLCNFRYGTFLFWAGWILVMTIFVATFLPETKGIPLGEIQKVWAGHWYWKKFVKEPLGGGKQVEI